MMHLCFEAFISLLYERIAGSRPGLMHRRQSPRGFLTRLGEGLGDATREIRPDDELYDRNRGAVILSSDAKYKGRIRDNGQLWNGTRIPASDFAQIFTACRTAKCSHGLIVQPFVEDLPADLPRQEIWKYRDAGEGLELTIGVLRLDLRDLNFDGSIAAIQALLEKFLIEMGVLSVLADAPRTNDWRRP
jgi:hypothetical protein